MITTDALVAIVGPTGVGKTKIGLEVAKRVGMDVLSVDSQQVYRGMDIGTGKEVGLGEWRQEGQWRVLQVGQVGIYGLDLTTPDRPMNVAGWRQVASRLLAEHRQQHGRGLLLVGGTGLYLQSLMTDSPEMQVKRNEALRQALAEATAEELYQRLKEVRSERAEQLNKSDRANPVRLMRALEVELAREAGEMPLSSNSVWSVQLLGLTMDRHSLYGSVDRRIKEMVDLGLVEEVRRLVEQYGWQQQAFKAIGYAQILDHLQERLSLEEAIKQIEHQTHDYIRRQYTWFRKQPVEWFELEQPEVVERVEQRVRDLMVD